MEASIKIIGNFSFQLTIVLNYLFFVNGPHLHSERPIG